MFYATLTGSLKSAQLALASGSPSVLNTTVKCPTGRWLRVICFFGQILTYGYCFEYFEFLFAENWVASRIGKWDVINDCWFILLKRFIGLDYGVVSTNVYCFFLISVICTKHDWFEKKILQHIHELFIIYLLFDTMLCLAMQLTQLSIDECR